MIHTTKLLAAALLLFILQGCKMENTPEEYFDRTALNTNLLMDFGAKDFKTMEQAKSVDRLMAFDDKSTFPAKSYEDHIRRYKIPYIDQTIAKIKDLKPTTETTPMINASLDLFGFARNKYETDYIKIARMMDSRASPADVEKAIAAMEEASFPPFEEKYKKLWDLAMPYAEKHGIEVKTF